MLTGSGARRREAASREGVIIVGASVAGLHAAARLAHEGVRVRVFERAPSLDPAARTLIVTSRLFELMGPRAAECVVNHVDGYELKAGSRSVSVDLLDGDIVIERRQLMATLEAEAAAAGAEILYDRRFVTLASGSTVELKFIDSEGRLHYEAGRSVIASDGALSSVAQALGVPRPPLVPLMQAIIPMPPWLTPRRSIVWFRPDDTSFFYWLIPGQDGNASLGVIADEGTHPRLLLDAFLKEHGLRALEYQAARIPRYASWIEPVRSAGEGWVYLAGDAAGQVKVSTIGGVINGLQGAEAAVDLALGRRSRALTGLRRELRAHLMVRRVMAGFNTAEHEHLLGLLDQPALRTLGRVNRDRAVRLVAGLLVRKPQLLLLAAGSLARSAPSRQVAVDMPVPEDRVA